MVQQDASKGPGDGTVVQLKNYRHVGQRLSFYGNATVVQPSDELFAADPGVQISPTFDIASTGLRTVTIAHGLAFSPSLSHIQLTVQQVTVVDDWAYNLLKADSVDATNIIAKINVSTASVTGGATARLGVGFPQLIANAIVRALRDLGLASV